MRFRRSSVTARIGFYQFVELDLPDRLLVIVGHLSNYVNLT